MVYLGRSPGGRAVAVKVVRERFASDVEFRARFRREVAAARLVTGAFTAPVLDADPEAEAPWLATAYLPGLSLREAVATAGPLPATTLRVLAAGMVEALAGIHRVGLVHRDLKPGNVMLTADGPRVIDFGIARPEDATAITRVGALIGTPGFMSPEQASGAVAEPASDIFSLGAVLVYAATGEEPFGSDATAILHRVLHVETDLSAITEPWLSDVVSACLHREADQRPSAAQLLDRLGEGTVPGGGWLPAPLAEEIDRRTEQARHWPGSPTVEPNATAPGPAVGGGAVESPTIVPTRSPRLNRRHLLFGGAVALTAAAGGVALVRGRDRPPTGASPSTPSPITAGTTPPPSAAPPKAILRWKAKVSDYYPESLFTTRGVVVVKTPEDELRALDVRSGRSLWKRNATLVGTVSGGMVFVAQNTNPRLALLDPVSGAQQWAYRVPFREIPVRLAVAGSVVCYGYDRIRALGVRDGRSRWTSAVNVEGGLVGSGGLLIAASETELVGVDVRTGRRRWRRPVNDVFDLLPGEDMVFVVDSQYVLHAIHSANGAVAWRKPDPGGWSRLQLGGGALYTGGGLGRVFALEPATGALLWSRQLDHDCTLEFAGDTLYAASTDKTLYALNPADGRVLWTYQADLLERSMNQAGVVSTTGQVFVGVREGHVIALTPPDGGSRAGA